MPSKFVTLKGGLDLATPPLAVSAGSLSYSLNFFESVKGGYTSVAGYERYDGQPSPSETIYHLVTISQWDLKTSATPLVVGAGLTVGSATYVIVSFYISDDGTVAEVVCDTAVGTPPTDLADNPIAFDTTCLIVGAEQSGALDEATDIIYRTDVQDKARALITEVTGTGAIRGVGQINDDVLAWRDNGSGNLVAYKASATGWTEVKYAQILAVQNTNAAVIGDLLNSGDYVVTGVYDYLPVDATKQMLTIAKADVAAADLVVTDALTRDSDAAAIGNVLEVISYTFNGGGKVRTVGHNFYGGTNTKRLYIADGVNCAAEYWPDYSTISPIASDYRVIDDVATHVIAHNARLFMATDGGTFITSVAGEPTVIDGLSGSQEIGLGDDITGFFKNNTQSLTIYTRNTTQVLQGTSPSDWTLSMASDNSGAIADCIAQVDDIFAVDDRGINQLSRTEKLGGFDASTITDDIQPLFIELKPTATCATYFRSLNQMRFFFGNRFLFVSRIPFSVGGQQAIRYGMMEGYYPDDILCASSEENLAGTERVFGGSSDGFIYQLDKGTSFDGVAIEHIMKLQSNHLKSPAIKKRYRHADFEIAATNAVDLTFYYELEKGKQSLEPRTLTLNGSLSGYDGGLWNEAIYDGFSTEYKRVSLVGSSTNIDFSIHHTSATDRPFTVSGYTLTFTSRGLRGYI